ncbi:hypothetical protein ACFPTR_04695 [Aliibacillus thermotolerans]|uniref:DhaK domain-containing protein n=1 Tax=Aliibacillus thermotolerans TaxID=1834418 RepID=A0ABW0U5H4_9BACI|nr:hypothetical protein [Aliibacillus thermotolerans]MDA3130070.1 hypothetical protein [Aliibacillus thermotolerans]
MALEEPTEEDVTQKINGISVSIEKQILPYVENVTLDMETGIDGKPGLVMIGGSGSNC